LRVALLNISTGGVRFRAPFYSFEEGDIFRMNFIISNSKKQLIAKVVNHADKKTVSSDYGCRFLQIE